MWKKFLSFLGQNPNQSDAVRKIIVIVMVFSVLGILVPTLLEVYVSFRGKDTDAVIECLPHLIAAAISIVKILNVYLNRENFRKLLDLVSKEWNQLRLNNELHVLEDITANGCKIAILYRNTLLSTLVVYICGPLSMPLIDMVLLNETRPLQQAFRANYLIFDSDKYFFYVYFHLAWGAFITVMIVITIDSLYILIIHHSGGLFAVCGYQVKKTMEMVDSEVDVQRQFKNCLMMHNKAIEFYNVLDESSRNSYLIQVGLNMMGISVTAVQTVLNLDRPEEAIKTALFLGGEQFHLFVVSLPGQILLDHCTQLRDNIYSSNWHGTPIKVQKLFQTMQIRCGKPCALTAGGLYEMNMENFATTIKTCMSYFTMLMSVRE